MPSLEEAAEKLSRQESRLGSLEVKFREAGSLETGATVKESELSIDIEKKRPETVAGVDGGLLKKRYSSGDIVATRAVAAVFSYGKKLEADYLPSRNPEPDFQVFSSGDSESLDGKAEAERLKTEACRGIEALENAETVLMDGSVVPSYSGSGEAIDRYRQLLEKAGQAQLVGVVEDSYGLKLSDMLEEKLGIEIGDVRDTLLMDLILEEGERSFVRRYSSSPVEHPVLQKLEDSTVNQLHTFYVKLSSRDLPLRIDYYGSPGDAGSIAGQLMFLKSSDSYTVPSPLLEADKRAKIPEKYLHRLEKRFSPRLRRRDRRGF